MIMLSLRGSYGLIPAESDFSTDHMSCKSCFLLLHLKICQGISKEDLLFKNKCTVFLFQLVMFFVVFLGGSIKSGENTHQPGHFLKKDFYVKMVFLRSSLQQEYKKRQTCVYRVFF